MAYFKNPGTPPTWAQRRYIYDANKQACLINDATCLWGLSADIRHRIIVVDACCTWRVIRARIVTWRVQIFWPVTKYQLGYFVMAVKITDRLFLRGDVQGRSRIQQICILDVIIYYTVPFCTPYPIYGTPDLFYSILFRGTSTYGTLEPFWSILFLGLLFCSWDDSNLRQENSRWTGLQEWRLVPNLEIVTNRRTVCHESKNFNK